MKPYVITIARQYGSGGKTVGKMLAKKLNIPFYDREIITMASENSGINPVLFSDERLKPDIVTRLRNHHERDTTVQNDSSKAYLNDDALVEHQAAVIRQMADQDKPAFAKHLVSCGVGWSSVSDFGAQK